MTRLIHVYLVRLEAKIRLVYSTDSVEDALAFEEEFNRRNRTKPTGCSAFADVHKTCTTQFQNKGLRRSPGTTGEQKTPRKRA